MKVGDFIAVTVEFGLLFADSNNKITEGGIYLFLLSISQFGIRITCFFKFILILLSKLFDGVLIFSRLDFLSRLVNL